MLVGLILLDILDKLGFGQKWIIESNNAFLQLHF